jgi:putative ABC transport system permease protein
MPALHGDRRWLQVYSFVSPKVGDVPVLMRTRRHGPDVTVMMERAIASVDRRIVVRPALSGDVYLRDSLAPTKFAMALLTAFAIIALVLAAVGLYGVIAYSVNQRTREIGVRVALGAEPRAVMGLVLGGGIRLALAGVVIGAAAAGAARVLRSMVYGVGPGDPWTFVVIGVVVGGVAILASYVPARRALRVEPVEALREL